MNNGRSISSQRTKAKECYPYEEMTDVFIPGLFCFVKSRSHLFLVRYNKAIGIIRNSQTKIMIVPYLSDVAIYCEQAVFFFFHPTLAVPRRVGRAAPSSHLPAFAPCSEFTLSRSRARCEVLNSNRSWKTMRSRSHVTLKTQIVLCFWRELWRDRERGSLSCSFVFPLKKSKGAALFICP